MARPLPAKTIQKILALKGKMPARTVTERFPVSLTTVYKIWDGRRR